MTESDIEKVAYFVAAFPGGRRGSELKAAWSSVRSELARLRQLGQALADALEYGEKEKWDAHSTDVAEEALGAWRAVVGKSGPDNDRPCCCGSWHFPYCDSDPRAS